MSPLPMQFQLPALWLCIVGALLVLGCIVYSVANFKAAEADAPGFAKRRARELLWALMPMAIVIAAAAPAIKEAEPQFARRYQESVTVAQMEHAARQSLNATAVSTN